MVICCKVVANSQKQHGNEELFMAKAWIPCISFWYMDFLRTRICLGLMLLVCPYLC
jgi:hypothetical protein